MLIEVKNLTKAYGEGEASTTVLDGASFNIEAGEFVAIMGPSGSGKSTLLHILGFLDKQTSGEYVFDNKRIEEHSEEELAYARNKKMGFIFQMFNLLPRTNVLENIKLPLIYSRIKESEWNQLAAEAALAVGLSHRLKHEPSKLSGGEQQRVAIARALVNAPQIIFADEPTGNLDSKSGAAVIEILQKLNEEKGITIILITHEIQTAEHAKRIIRLRDGRIESDQLVNGRLRAGEHFLK